MNTQNNLNLLTTDNNIHGSSNFNIINILKSSKIIAQLLEYIQLTLTPYIYFYLILNCIIIILLLIILYFVYNLRKNN